MKLETQIGSVTLPSPVLTAAGTAGHGDELSAYGDLGAIGAVVTKSLASFAWEGNPAPRVTANGDHMLNAVGLSGPGVSAWRDTDLAKLKAKGARVIGSIWGRSVADYADAAKLMNGAAIEALEVNASCPNLEGRTGMFAHSASLTAELVSACKVAGVPLWVKLSPNTPDIVAIAGAALEAGADGLVLVNTVLGLSIDIESRRAALGNGGGGLSGPGILPVALRSVYEVHQAFPSAPLIGVGGVSSSNDVVAMLMAGASAVEIGTATFANPRAPWKIQRGLVKWMQRNKVSTISELIGAAHA